MTITFPHPLDGVQARLDRAKQHIVELDTAVKDFERQHPLVTGTDLDPDDPSKFGHSIRQLTEPPQALRIIAGEVLYLLRSSLDHVVGQLVIQHRQLFQLVCDVTCTQATGPCIQFGAPHIKLRLNGFTITGPAIPPTDCVTTTNFLPEDGIAGNGQSFVQILGPGMVQWFRRPGLFLASSSNVAVKHVTSHHNCFSGIFMGGVTDSDIEENVSVRNAIASAQFLCGGNINGIRVSATAVNNLIRRNVIAGNPPVQVDPTPVPAVGVDVRDFSPAGANTFEENLCITYEGATVPPPCPNFPKFAGHRNPSKGSHDEHEDDKDKDDNDR